MNSVKATDRFEGAGPYTVMSVRDTPSNRAQLEKAKMEGIPVSFYGPHIHSVEQGRAMRLRKPLWNVVDISYKRGRLEVDTVTHIRLER